MLCYLYLMANPSSEMFLVVVLLVVVRLGSDDCACLPHSGLKRTAESCRGEMTLCCLSLERVC